MLFAPHSYLTRQAPILANDFAQAQSLVSQNCCSLEIGFVRNEWCVWKVNDDTSIVYQCISIICLWRSVCILTSWFFILILSFFNPWARNSLEVSWDVEPFWIKVDLWVYESYSKIRFMRCWSMYGRADGSLWSWLEFSGLLISYEEKTKMRVFTQSFSLEHRLENGVCMKIWNYKIWK